MSNHKNGTAMRDFARKHVCTRDKGVGNSPVPVRKIASPPAQFQHEIGAVVYEDNKIQPCAILLARM